MASVVDGSGGWMSNGLYRCLSATCQPGPVGTSSAAGFRNSSGFLSTFLFYPHLDNDMDGVADEDDPDDDNDSLVDADELSGAGFDPQTPTDSMIADSDGDGADDGAEAAAGTNPRDSASQLRISDIQVSYGEAVITWGSRESYSYDLVVSDAAGSLNSNGTVVSTITAASGVGPWRESVSSATNAIALPEQFYRINVVPR